MKITQAAVLSALLLAPAGVAQNLLTNADFEAGLTGWNVFGNAFPATANPPNVVPLSGTEICSMFGPFAGTFGVSGIFQEFAAAPGDEFTIDCFTRHFSGDALTGDGPTDTVSNWVVQKIAFFNGPAEIAGFESVVLNGQSPTDTWIDNAPVTGTAPAGTTSVQALILFLQPGADPGAVQIDDVSFTGSTAPEAPDGKLLANAGFENGLTDWSAFGNASAESVPTIVPQSGTSALKMFGNFTGGFNVTGVFQTFGAVEGQTFEMDAASRNDSGDAMSGANSVVMKIAFFDGGGTEIGAAEATILDAASPADTWIDNAPISGTAPAGTASVQALLLFLQPAFDGGSALIDDVCFSTSADCDIALNGGFETGDLSDWQEFPSAPGQITVESPGSGSAFAARINNTAAPSAGLIKNANLAAGSVEAGEDITISFDMRGTTAVGGVVFAELFSEIDGGGVSQSEILGGGPLFPDPDPSVWTTFSFTTTTGPDVSGGVTLQLAAITGAAVGSTADIYFDNVRVLVERTGATWTNYGTGWAGTNGVPGLTLDTNPALGANVNILIGNALGADTPGCFFLGNEQTDVLTPFGGSFLTNALAVVPMPYPAAGDSINITIPTLSVFCGAELYAQSVHVDSGATSDVAFSRGLRFIFGAGVPAPMPTTADLIISEIVDATLPSGLPKFVELTNCGTTTIDLSNYSIGNINNGGTALGFDATVLTGMLAPGDSWIISYESGNAPGSSSFFSTYGFDADDLQLGSFINGDDVVVLFQGAALAGDPADGSGQPVQDIYGVVGVDGTGEPWEYTDGFSFRNPGAGPSSTFDASQWTIGGADSLETGDDVTELALILSSTTPGTHVCN